MNNYIFLLLLLLYEFFLLCIVWRKLNGCLFSPSLYTVSVFIVSTSLCVYCIDYWDIIFYPETFIVISLGLTSVVIADIKSYPKNIVIPSEITINLISIPNKFKISLSIYSVIATVLYLREIYNIGLANSLLLGEAISAVKEDFSYYEDHFNPIIRQGYKLVMAIAYIYTYIFINNYIVCKQKLIKSFWFIIPLISGICINLISGSRGDMLRLVLLFLFAYYMSVWQANFWQEKPNSRLLKISLPIITSMLAIFFMARLFVKADIDAQERIGGPVEYIAYYVGSPIQVLNLHTKKLSDAHNPNPDIPFACCTMSGLYNIASNWGFVDKSQLKKQVIGIGFEELGGDSNAAGNVDTFFALSRIDFGILGMCIYSFILYYLISKFFYRNIIFKDMTCQNVRNFLKFSFFYYIVEMSFYSDCTVQILCQTGILQYITFIILLKLLIIPQYFKPVLLK